MLNSKSLKILESISKIEFQKNSEIIFQSLLYDLSTQLELEPYQGDIRFIISKKEISESNDIFNIGVNRINQGTALVVYLDEKFIKFLGFIVLREIYNLFVPRELRNYESVQLVINQIIMNDLRKHDNLNEWKTLIKGSLEQYDLLSGGFNRLTAFDRLESFFKRQKSGYNPIQFFFHYIRRNISLMSEKIEDIDHDIHYIFFDKFETFISKSMINDEIIETIRCIIEIFYDISRYRDLMSYKKHFQELKEQGKLNTELSLRKFTKNMDWIKNYSYIAPSYQLNWNAINMCVLFVNFRFNPVINKTKIFTIIENLPFFIAPQISRSGFFLSICGYFVIPGVYLKDLKDFIKKLSNFGYITKPPRLFLINNLSIYSINLNYFREYSQNHCIINPDHRFYNDKYEIEFDINFGTKTYDFKLNLLEFLLLDRIRFFSVSGLGFELRTETLHKIKSDLLNEIIVQRSIINNLKKSLNTFQKSPKLTKEILNFIDSNRNFGFFYIKFILEEYLKLCSFMEEILKNNQEIRNLHEFRNILKNQYHTHLIEKNIMLNSLEFKDIIIGEFFTNFLDSKNNHRKIVEKYHHFYNFFKSCYNLKMFNLKTIKELIINKNLVQKIYKIKENKLRNNYETYKLYKVTNQEIENIMNKFLNNKPSIIQPNLINTIIADLYFKDFFHLILVDSPELRIFLKILKNFLPRLIIREIKDLNSYEDLVHVELFTPNITIKEKAMFYSIIFNNFKEDIRYAKSFLWSGYLPAFSGKNFYDFTKKEFFYTKDLFGQFFLYVQRILGEPLEPFQEKPSHLHEKFWTKEKNIINLVKVVNNRVSTENIDVNINPLKRLSEFHLNLREYLLDEDQFNNSKKEYYYTNYIKKIRFIPSFHHFGFGQYFLYLYPSDMNELDFKLLFTNTFQQVKYPACIDNSNSLFIKYIIPHAAPQLKYLHWLTKSKKVIREYCGFFIKKVYHILHFSYNLSSEGWVYDKDRFKIHMQSILFKPDYNFQITKIKEYKITDEFISSYFGPDSPEFESLSNIYNWQSIDIKSFLRTKKARTVNHIINLLEKGLIFPYLSLKNLDLHDKIHIIIPSLKPKLNNTLVKIFSFFNLAFIYEIEGEYFIYGFEQEVKFQNGLMIKIYFPKCEISEFMRLFDLLFEYLKIKDYLIFNDLVDGKNLIKSIYGGLAFLNSYNPLKNLEWNEQDKIWQNPKIFTSKFEPIYPDLISKDK